MQVVSRGVVALVLSCVGLLPSRLALAYPDQYTPYAVYAEVGGRTLIGGAFVDVRPFEALSLQGGVSVFPLCLNTCVTYYGFYAGFSSVVGKAPHYLEVSAGYSHFVGDDDAKFFVPSIGYRRQPASRGLFQRVAAVLLMRRNDPTEMLPWVGYSVGYAF